MEDPSIARAGFPAGALGAKAARERTATSLAGIRAGGITSIAFPGALFQAAPSGLR
jgi:hypothetical protein